MKDFIKKFKKEIRSLYVCLNALIPIEAIVLELERYIREYGIEVEDACDAIIRKHAKHEQHADHWKKYMSMSTEEFRSRSRWLERKRDFHKPDKRIANKRAKRENYTRHDNLFDKLIDKARKRNSRQKYEEGHYDDDEEEYQEYDELYEDKKIKDPEPSYALDTLDADIFRHLLNSAKAEEIATEMIKLGYDKKLVKKHLPRLSKKWEDMLQEKWLKLWIMQKHEDAVPSHLDWGE